MRVLAVVAVVALIGCWFWWLEEEKWCEALYDSASPVAFTLCMPLSPFVAIGIVFVCGGAFIWMRLRGHQS